MISASSLSRIMRCPGSEALPQSDRRSEVSELGTAIHRYLERVSEIGAEHALAEVPEQYRGECALIPLDKLPAARSGSYAAEVAFAYSPSKDTGRELGRKLERGYVVEGDEIPGTADAVGLIDDDAVVVFDYKSGYATLPPPEEMEQLKFLGLAACRAYGRSRAVVATIQVHPGYEPRITVGHLSQMDLDSFAFELAEAVDRVEIAKLEQAAGNRPSLTSGEHCRYCPAFEGCPVKGALLASMLQDPDRWSEGCLDNIDPHSAASVLLMFRSATHALERVGDALKQYALQHGIDLPSGRRWMQVESRRDSIDGLKAWQRLNAKYGKAVADEAVTLKVTKKALGSALVPVATEQGRSATQLVGEAMADFYRNGAAHKVPHKEMREIKPKVTA